MVGKNWKINNYVFSIFSIFTPINYAHALFLVSCFYILNCEIYKWLLGEEFADLGIWHKNGVVDEIKEAPFFCPSAIWSENMCARFLLGMHLEMYLK